MIATRKKPTAQTSVLTRDLTAAAGRIIASDERFDGKPLATVFASSAFREQLADWCINRIDRDAIRRD